MAPREMVAAVQRMRRAMNGSSAVTNTKEPLPFAGGTPDGDVAVLPGEIGWNPPMWYRHLWTAMPWFALPSFSDGHVRLNVRGRERDGIVPLDDYERTCDELEATLRLATDPRSGEPIVDEVLRLRAGDPLAPDGPGADLVVTWRSPVDSLEHPACDTVGPFAFSRSGSHTVNGFLLVTGAGIPHATLDERPALDVPPTLLSLLGWACPSDLSGTAVPGLAGALTD
jgi:hypothetical protein